MGQTPRAGSLLRGCGMEHTPRWVDKHPSGLHGTELQTLGVTLNLCTMIMRRYYLGVGELVSPQRGLHCSGQSGMVHLCTAVDSPAFS